MTFLRSQWIIGGLVLFLLASSVSAKIAPAETSKDKVCRQAVGALSEGKVKDPKRQVLRETDIASVHVPGMKTAAQEILKKQENYNRTRSQRNRVQWITMDPKKGYRISSEGLRELCALYAVAILKSPKSWCGGKHCPGWKKKGQGQGGGQGNPPPAPPPGGQQNPPPVPPVPAPGDKQDSDAAPLSKKDAEVIERSVSSLGLKLIAGPLLNEKRADVNTVHIFEPAFENTTQATMNFFNLVGRRLKITTACRYGWFTPHMVGPLIDLHPETKTAYVTRQGKLVDEKGIGVYWAYRVDPKDETIFCADPARGDEYFTLTLISDTGDVPALSVKIQW